MTWLHFPSGGPGRSSTALWLYRHRLRGCFSRALGYLQEKDSSLFIPKNFADISFKGYYSADMACPVGGSCPNKDKIWVSFNPLARGFKNDQVLFDHMVTLLAHEMNHTTRHQTPHGCGDTLLGRVVAEGIAVYVEGLAGHRPVSKDRGIYDYTIPSEKVGTLESLLRLNQNQPWRDSGRWIADPQRELARYAYCLGLRLVEGYMARYPGTRPHELVHLAPSEFLPG